MSAPTVSVVLNVHREADYLPKTLKSIAASVEHAVCHGVDAEMVVVFDRSDPRTIEVVNSAEAGFPCRVFSTFVDNGNLALSRNAGVDASHGEFVLVMDADDLVSVNFVFALLQALVGLTDASLAFARYCLGFGDVNYIMKVYDAEEISTLAFIDNNPLFSRVMFRREVFRENRYVATAPASPFHFEDWHWNCECLAAGLRFAVADDAILYYRQRSGSLMDEARKQRQTQIAPSRLFTPHVYTAVAEADYRRWLAHGLPSFDPAAIRANLSRLSEDVAFQARFEPQLTLDLFRRSPVLDNRVASGLHVGAAYYEICRVVGAARFEHVFILPFHVSGGAELYIGRLLEAIYQMAPEVNVLAVLGETTSSASNESELPPNVVVVNLGRDWAQLSMEQRGLVALKLIQSAAPRAHVHVRHSAYGDSFLDSYSCALLTNPLVLYPFLLPRRPAPPPPGRVLVSTEYIDRNIAAAKWLVTDNLSIVREYSRLSGAPAPSPKWRCLRVPHTAELSDEEIERRRQARRAAPIRKALWASRIDFEKRPSLVAKIAETLARRGAACELEMYGSSVFRSAEEVARLTRGVNYRGEFKRFADLPTADYDCLLYTSLYDGLPNVLLEAASWGLPIIAPDIGGISEFVEDGVTGVLLPSVDDDMMAESYVDAIQSILDEPEFGSRLALGAARRIRKMFGSESHREAVRQLFFAAGDAGKDAVVDTAPDQRLGGVPARAADGGDALPLSPEVAHGARSREKALIGLLEARNAELRKFLQAERERAASLIGLLEARNAELRKFLQAERERAASKNSRPLYDARASIRNDEISVDGLAVPVNVFRRFAKLWKRPFKRAFVRILLWPLGARV